MYVSWAHSIRFSTIPKKQNEIFLSYIVLILLIGKSSVTFAEDGNQEDNLPGRNMCQIKTSSVWLKGTPSTGITTINEGTFQNLKDAVRNTF